MQPQLERHRLQRGLSEQPRSESGKATLLNNEGYAYDKSLGVVHLKPHQKGRRPFAHPLLDNAEEMADEAMDALIAGHFAGDKKATDDLILGNLILVKWLIGRYLHHWPETRRFEEDMVCEGFAAVTEGVRNLKESIEAGKLKAILVVKIKSAVETLVNDLRSTISASLRTNYRRLEAGEDPEYQYGDSIHALTLESDSSSEGRIGGLGRVDDTPAFIDALDALEVLRSVDGEEMVDLVLAAIEQQHATLESELTDRERNLIHVLASVIGGKAA